MGTVISPAAAYVVFSFEKLTHVLESIQCFYVKSGIVKNIFLTRRYHYWTCPFTHLALLAIYLPLPFLYFAYKKRYILFIE